ncbi:hypothetical protein TWF696_000341 [Orbilia brochopaga]|uniref:Uncharacterized protein n=1 Tax=Orbilia brochopaga TaxID=3140254 RepID=A0AAV9VB06_9PEZI
MNSSNDEKEKPLPVSIKREIEAARSITLDFAEVTLRMACSNYQLAQGNFMSVRSNCSPEEDRYRLGRLNCERAERQFKYLRGGHRNAKAVLESSVERDLWLAEIIFKIVVDFLEVSLVNDKLSQNNYKLAKQIDGSPAAANIAASGGSQAVQPMDQRAAGVNWACMARQMRANSKLGGRALKLSNLCLIRCYNFRLCPQEQLRFPMWLTLMGCKLLPQTLEDLANMTLEQAVTAHRILCLPARPDAENTLEIYKHAVAKFLGTDYDHYMELQLKTNRQGWLIWSHHHVILIVLLAFSFYVLF